MILHDSGRSGLGEDRGERTSPPGGGPRARGPQAGPVTPLVEEFAAAWERGERPAAEAFLDRHPALMAQPDAAIRVIYEEVCSRQGEGQEVTLSELVHRFPQWRWRHLS